MSEIYKLGDHRLLCGDSTIKENMDLLMGGMYADMVFTDPPYNMSIPGDSDDGKWSGMDRFHKKTSAIRYMADFKPKDFLNVLPDAFEAGHMNAYIFCSKDLLPEYLNFAVDKKYAFNVLVWCKKSGKPVGNTHWPNVEYIVHYRKSAVWNNAVDWADYSKFLMYERQKKCAVTGYHPTAKPVDLVSNEIKISSNPGGIVVDLFGGSGTTMMACEETGRKCYMAEIDPFYCEIIIKRWERMTGMKAEHENRNN